MKRIPYVIALHALCYFVLLAACTAYAQTPADAEQDRRLARDQARQDKVTVKLADTLEERTAINRAAQNEASVVANAAQDEAAIIVAMAQDERTTMNEDDIKSVQAQALTLEAQALTDRQFMAVMVAVMLIVLIAVWWMMYRVMSRLEEASGRLEGASKSTWEGIEKILVRTELLQTYLEKEAPAVVAEFEAAHPTTDAK